MNEETKRKRGRPRKTLGEARNKAEKDKAAPELTRVEKRLLKQAGEFAGKRAKRGLDYALRVAAEFEAQFIRAGQSPENARREAARLASDDLRYRQTQEAKPKSSETSPDGGRTYFAVQTIWEQEPTTGEWRPVSIAGNARDCGDEVSEPLSDRTKAGSSHSERSLMDKISRKLASKSGQRARDAAKRTAGMGTLGDELQAAGQVNMVKLAQIRPGRRPKDA